MTKADSKDWRPSLYLKFDSERTQPSVDLVSRIRLEAPESIVDIGCGPGNSTNVLHMRWPSAEITGIDSSPAMIEKAKTDYPDHTWIVGDGQNPDPDKHYDLVFSNATIQWMPDHDRLMETFAAITNKGGVVAVQMPLYHEMPIASMIDTTFHEMFPDADFDFNSVFTFHKPGFYYDALSKHMDHVNIWVTSYYHEMGSHEDIYRMMESTGLRPYFEKIGTEEEKRQFEKRVEKGLTGIYSETASGKVLYPFKRLFIIAVS